MNKRRFFIGAGIILMLVSFFSFIYVNAYSRGEECFSFDSSYKEKEVTLEATIWDDGGAEYGVVICPGYSCDRQKWKPFVNVFRAYEMSVMTFDYSGQGASGGTIGFDNAKTDCIPLEIFDAVNVFHEKTGIAYDHIILAGHSMGGRSILRLLQDYNNEDAETLVTGQDIKNVILLSPEVNYHKNEQASLFAGTTDAKEEPWVSYNADYIKGCNVYLYGSTADDIVASADVVSIFEHIGGKSDVKDGVIKKTNINDNGDRVTVGITNGVLHSYQMYSPKFVSFVNEALSEITGKTSAYAPGRFRFIYIGWFSALAGIFVLLFGLNRGKSEEFAGERLPVITDVKAFLIRKLIMWIPGIIMAFAVCSLAVVMPFGSPVMNIPYMCFISGYGLVMLFSYRKGKFKGTDGKLPVPSFKTAAGMKDTSVTIAVTFGICFFTWFILRESMYRLMPLNMRVFWLAFATALMTVGYYISGVESDMLSNNEASVKTRIVYSLIQYIPLFLFVLFYLVIKSYSGLIGQILNVFLMYILCIPIGDYVRKRSGNRMYGAVITACLFQLLMITSAALISMF